MDIPITAEKHYCGICSQKKSPTNENLIQHISSSCLVFDHGIKDVAFVCDICPKRVFFVENIYKKHLQDKHNMYYNMH